MTPAQELELLEFVVLGSIELYACAKAEGKRRRAEQCVRIIATQPLWYLKKMNFTTPEGERLSRAALTTAIDGLLAEAKP